MREMRQSRKFPLHSPGTADGKRPEERLTESGMGANVKSLRPRRTGSGGWIGRIEGVIAQARSRAVAAVNLAMVYAYHEIGRLIVEEEQHGHDRTGYGEKTLSTLSTHLTEHFGKGWSVENLKLMRRFYLVYRNRVNTVYPISGNGAGPVPARDASCPPDAEGGTGEGAFTLSWSHYLKLMRIENPDERRFYEIEATEGRWSLKELQRQFDSALYERLALSRDKAKVRELARRGLVIERPEDVVKDPYVLEFLRLPESEAYTESELEMTLPEGNRQIFASKYEPVLPSKEQLRDVLMESGKLPPAPREEELT